MKRNRSNNIPHYTALLVSSPVCHALLPSLEQRIAKNLSEYDREKGQLRGIKLEFEVCIGVCVDAEFHCYCDNL